ncbi:MAG: hypothetical protein HeimC3_12380 [Candidatus Heimdallarchaeota archaeon LC_3]|nr:MAG: hypothetical protein HeimC3_12380 [Candidatus Heimdallarchaeota archaeon LC_3]
MRKSTKKGKTIPVVINSQIRDNNKLRKKLEKKEIKKERLREKLDKKSRPEFRAYIYSKNSQNDDYEKNIEDSARKIRHESATIRIGKNGVTQGIVDEIKTQIKNETVVKVQILKNCPTDLTDIYAELEHKSASKLWRKAGRSGIFIENEN